MQQHVALCVLACSQTLYFLFKVCRARVLENKNSEGFIDHSTLILTCCVFSKRKKNEKKNKIMSVYRLCVWENFGLHNRILSLQQVAQNQIRQNLCNLSQGQNYIAETKISTKIIQYTPSNMKPRDVIQLVAATYHLLCSNCYNNYQSSNNNQPRFYQNNLYWVEILSTL